MFGHKLKLTIGTRSGSLEKVYDENMQIDFTINRTKEGKTADTANIMIYNADKTTYNTYFTADDCYVKIEAGYQDDEFGMLFNGDVITASQFLSGVDYVIDIQCGDGIKAIDMMQMNKGYAPGVSIGTILDEVVDGMVNFYGVVKSAVTSKNIKSVLDKKLEFGSLLKGRASKILDDMVKKERLDFGIANNVLRIYDTNFQEFEFKLNKNSGLINSPRVKNIQKTGDAGSKTVPAIEFDCLIIPGIVPGHTVTIESRFVNGTYTVQEMNIQGQTRGNQWEMAVTAI